MSPLAFSFCVLHAAGFCCPLPPAAWCPWLRQSHSWSHQQLGAHSSCKVTLGPTGSSVLMAPALDPPKSPASLCSTHRASSQARRTASASSFLLPASVMSPCSFAAKDVGSIQVSPCCGGAGWLWLTSKCISCFSALASLSPWGLLHQLCHCLASVPILVTGAL